jgi:anti-sigma factor RsiW
METLALDDILLVAFADGELDPMVSRLVEARVASDPALTARVAMFRDTAILLKAALSTPEYMEVPSALTAKLSRLVARHAGPSLGTRLRKRAWIPMAAAVALAGFISATTDLVRHLPFGTDPRPMLVSHVLDEIADYHSVFAVEQEHRVEVPASRQAHLESWLGGRLKMAFHVPDLRSLDLEFEGAACLRSTEFRTCGLLIWSLRGPPACDRPSSGPAVS